MTDITQDLTYNLKKSLKLLYPENPVDKMACVEIGSFEGLGSLLINNNLCNNENSKLYCIDHFEDLYVKNNEKLAWWNHACVGQLGRFRNNTKNFPKIIEFRGTSDDMICKLDDNTVDFVYIDGDHSPEQVYKDAVNIYTKMKNNGVILFDDYLFTENGVITQEGIDKFLSEYDGKYELLFKNYQVAVKVKKLEEVVQPKVIPLAVRQAMAQKHKRR
jgi:predicted O-methyltransferase YrrM